jgi:cytochrome c oxidase subunit II
MMQLTRRRILSAALGSVATSVLARAVAASRDERVDLVAGKFQFSRTEIKARKGRALTIVLSTADFPHGFAIPELGVRADCVPGKPVEVVVVPDRVGRFQFLCDNFCGEGHDRMSGVMVVTEDAS